MWKIAVVAVVAGCGAETHSASVSAPASPAASDPVTAECRTRQSAAIGYLNTAIGPNCANNTMRFSLLAFDAGVSAGVADGLGFVLAQAQLCACRGNACSEQRYADVLRFVQRVMVDEVDAALHEGVSHLMQTLSSHPCIDAAVASELFKHGHACGFVVEGRSPVERRRAATINANATNDSLAIETCMLEKP